MNAKLNIQQLNTLIDESNYAKLFELLDNKVPSSYKSFYSQLKNDFISGKAGTNFNQQIRILIGNFVPVKKTMNLLIITSTKTQIEEKIKNLIHNLGNEMEKNDWILFEKNEIANHYGNSLLEWKPFCKDTIEELLKAFEKRFNIALQYDIETFDEEEKAHNYIFKINQKKEQNYVLISDSLALNYGYNGEVAKKFDSITIGGCIIPICNNLNTTVKKFMKNIVNDVFKSVLCRCIYKYASLKDDDNGYVYIDLEVPDEHSFLRKLNHIACFNPNITDVDYKDLDKYPTPNSL